MQSNMTTQELKGTYQINFTNEVTQNDGFPAKIRKRPSTFNASLTEYLSERRNIGTLNSTFIPEIKNLLDGNSESFYDNGQFVLMDSTSSITEIHDEEAATNPVATLPTQDYYDILVLWRDFLLEPPLDGTKIDDNETKVVAPKSFRAKVLSLFGRTTKRSY